MPLQHEQLKRLRRLLLLLRQACETVSELAQGPNAPNQVGSEPAVLLPLLLPMSLLLPLPWYPLS